MQLLDKPCVVLVWLDVTYPRDNEPGNNNGRHTHGRSVHALQKTPWLQPARRLPPASSESLAPHLPFPFLLIIAYRLPLLQVLVSWFLIYDTTTSPRLRKRIPTVLSAPPVNRYIPNSHLRDSDNLSHGVSPYAVKCCLFVVVSSRPLSTLDASIEIHCVA